MKKLPPQIWFLTGSQSLYGEETLRKVAADSQEIVKSLNNSGALPLELVFCPVLTSSEAIREVILRANADCSCAGLVLWMHTFSPSKMWIGGLSALRKPFLHLHTQYGKALPWETIDMDFMNLHQSAHGDREAGFIHTRMRMNRKVVVGHWSDSLVQEELGDWARVARAWQDLQGAKIVRFGDNMREVAVTDGDKVAAEMRFGFSVNTHGIGDLVETMDGFSDAEVDALCREYEETYSVSKELAKGGERHESLRYSARIELGLDQFLRAGNFRGFTTTFQDLHGMKQLPGMAVQRMMAKGYGFGAEGDWKTAALLRAMKVMAEDLGGKTSFMEDYTYDLGVEGGLVLGAHMLEICESIAEGRPACEIHPLGIGGKEDPVRLVFDSLSGPAINVTLVDLGSRFRILVHEVEAVKSPAKLPRLPVARAVWKPLPDFRTGCAAWIQAGGAHHTGYSLVLSARHIEDFAAMFGVECVVIDSGTKLRNFQNELNWNEAYYHLRGGMVS